jgi:hypothetical protein
MEHTGPRGLLDRLSHWRQVREAKACTARYRREAPPPPPGLEFPDSFGYVHCKAFVYLTVGPAKYRRMDYFHLPPEEWSPELLEIVERGCEQIVQWRGLTPDSPFENIGIEGFYALLQVFHFELAQQSAFDGRDGTILDRMEMIHVVSSEGLTLYNRVRQEKIVHPWN